MSIVRRVDDFNIPIPSLWSCPGHREISLGIFRFDIYPQLTPFFNVDPPCVPGWGGRKNEQMDAVPGKSSQTVEIVVL